MSEADQERNCCEPIQPHYVSDGTAGVAVSLPLNKERIERHHVDFFSWGGLDKAPQSARGMPMADIEEAN
jgi:hypothetical protein